MDLHSHAFASLTLALMLCTAQVQNSTSQVVNSSSLLWTTGNHFTPLEVKLVILALGSRSNSPKMYFIDNRCNERTNLLDENKFTEEAARNAKNATSLAQNYTIAAKKPYAHLSIAEVIHEQFSEALNRSVKLSAGRPHLMYSICIHGIFICSFHIGSVFCTPLPQSLRDRVLHLLCHPLINSRTSRIVPNVYSLTSKLLRFPHCQRRLKKSSNNAKVAHAI